MSQSLNKVMLLGNLGKEPVIKTFSNGGKSASFSIATTDSWKDKTSGEYVSKTFWHRVVVKVPALVDVTEKYLKKGSKVYIEGSHEERTYTAADDTEKSISEIVIGMTGKIILLDAKEKEGASKGVSDFSAAAFAKSDNFLDDQMPF
jgi:single-strand DNA-binding protein